jgi:two-component system cell cycle response regulator
MARVLVVEDNRVNLELMVYLLRSFGHEVAAVPSGEAALELLQRQRVDLVLCDVQMPRMDGLQLLRELRGQPLLAELPVVAVTASAMVGDRERLLAAGFDGYLAKPIDPQLFVAQVEAYLGRAGSLAGTEG